MEYKQTIEKVWKDTDIYPDVEAVKNRVEELGYAVTEFRVPRYKHGVYQDDQYVNKFVKNGTLENAFIAKGVSDGNEPRFIVVKKPKLRKWLVEEVDALTDSRIVFRGAFCKVTRLDD